MKKLSHKEYIRREERHHDKVAKYYTLRREKDYIWEVPEQILLFNKIKFIPHEKVVDMGCGPSVSIKNILPKRTLENIEYIGIDISKRLLEYGKKNIPKGTFRHGDIETVKIKKNSIDKIISLGALHHVENKTKTLKNWSLMLRENGKLLLREPTKEALKKGEGESPMEEGVELASVMEFCEANGLKISSCEHFNSKAFHLFNRVLIKCGLKKWQEVRSLWFPVVYIDNLLCKLSGNRGIFKGEAFTMIISK